MFAEATAADHTPIAGRLGSAAARTDAHHPGLGCAPRRTFRPAWRGPRSRRRSTRDPRVLGFGAFFDLDRTLVAGFSVFTFLLDGLLTGRIGPTGVGQFLRSAVGFQLGQHGFSAFVGETLTLLGGAAEADFEALAERVFAERLASDVFPEARALVRAHQRKGHTLAIVSSATRYQAEPLARDLGIPHVLCTRLEVENGRFTGSS